METLAIKYRPATFEDVIEQDSVRTILQNQLDTNTIKNTYLFVGASGCGKTTCARIFANEINKHKGHPIEIDGASYNGVDAVRNISAMAKTKSIDSEYKIFIIDECHMITIQGWNAMLKLIEEPPVKTIFIFCTTNPEKIPITILSRVQRYDFHKISQDGIVNRLDYILNEERAEDDAHDMDAIEYIARLSKGGMRSAIVLLDKCLSYNPDITMENVLKALGTADYDNMRYLLNAIHHKNDKDIFLIINNIDRSGIDLKTFVKQLFEFCSDINMYKYTNNTRLTQLPQSILDGVDIDLDSLHKVLEGLMELMNLIKYDDNPKNIIQYVLWRASK